MKTLNIPLDDKDFKKLENVKDKLGTSWQEFLMFLLNKFKQEEK